MSHKWKKLGLIIRPDQEREWMQSHAMIPVAEHRAGNVFRVYFSGRDSSNRSLISYAEIDITRPKQIIRWSDGPVLGLGALGAFDDNGVTPSWIVDEGPQKYLYYIGWNQGATVRMLLFGGLAVSDDDGETFTRVSRAPIIERTDVDPFLNTAPCVLKEGNLWRMWYVAGEGWKHKDLPLYNIKYAESNDGIAWRRTGITCIDFSSQDEHALARPCVVKEDGVYRMWFAHKGSAYRAGYAESADGIRWERDDSQVGIDVSEDGPDSEMIEYFFVFRHNGKRYMLYNGNTYGKDGICLAVGVD